MLLLRNFPHAPVAKRYETSYSRSRFDCTNPRTGVRDEGSGLFHGNLALHLTDWVGRVHPKEMLIKRVFCPKLSLGQVSLPQIPSPCPEPGELLFVRQGSVQTSPPPPSGERIPLAFYKLSAPHGKTGGWRCWCNDLFRNFSLFKPGSVGRAFNLSFNPNAHTRPATRQGLLSVGGGARWVRMLFQWTLSLPGLVAKAPHSKIRDVMC